MIAQLRGQIVDMSGDTVVMDVAGVGYAVNVSAKTHALLAVGVHDVTLFTQMQVTPDSMTLFGFEKAREREAFRILVQVQGVGPRAAMSILSVLSPAELGAAALSGDKAMVSRAEGVGAKIAGRVVNELAGQAERLIGADGAVVGQVSGSGTVDDGIHADVISALVNLGYGRAEAFAALKRVRATDEAGDDAKSLIGATLRELGK